MLFVQFRFLVFFLVVFSVHWLLRSNTARKVWLLAASHFFYACLFLGGSTGAALGGLFAGNGHYGPLFTISAGLFLPLTVLSAVSRRRYLRTRRGR